MFLRQVLENNERLIRRDELERLTQELDAAEHLSDICWSKFWRCVELNPNDVIHISWDQFESEEDASTKELMDPEGQFVRIPFNLKRETRRCVYVRKNRQDLIGPMTKLVAKILKYQKILNAYSDRADPRMPLLHGIE